MIDVHVPGLVWSAAFVVAAVVVRLMPEPPPPRHVVDKYLHVPSTFPTHLANRGLGRSMAPDSSGMTPGMQAYGPGGAPRQGNLRTLSRSLALWAAAFAAMAVISPYLV